ncbi:alpha/beta hydrolase [Endozoicomonas acroporae]|uniref:alpha/beta hydrolase n=1 Tax=Endozoicomonas acroporae TaxID=1701104 RepID=UPI0013D00BB3|nr:alpha/beta hydrolase-fold protein [Endozoicomonas acroporae]
MKSKFSLCTLPLAVSLLSGCQSAYTPAAPESLCPESRADQSVMLCVTSLPDNHPQGEPVYLAGTMNQWHAGGDQHKQIILKDNGNGSYSHKLSFNKPGDIHLFKFTRGDWSSVEIDNDRYDAPNRKVQFTGDRQTIMLTIDKWADLEGGSLGSRSTLVGKLETLTTTFPQNDDERTIRIWLPEKYDGSRKEPYPVIYAWDGQNLFDKQTAGYGMEWQLDETLTALEEEYVVIGFDSRRDALSRYIEYSGLDWTHPTVGGVQARGSETVDFVVDTLIPALEKQYNISSNPADRTLMGSSMGGYITLYAMSYRPGVFGTGLALSHATSNHYGGKQLREYFRKNGFAGDARLYLDMGGQETVGPWGPDEWLQGHHAMVTALDDAGISLQHRVIADGVHDETAWAKRFGEIFQTVIKQSQ